MSNSADTAPYFLSAAADPEMSRLAENTRRAYAGDWDRFSQWAVERDLTVLPSTADTVSEYIAYLTAQCRSDGTRRYSAATVRRAVSAIDFIHRREGHLSPGADRRLRTKAVGQRGTAPMLHAPSGSRDTSAFTSGLERIEVQVWPRAVIGRRDLALLNLGWALRARRQELVSLNREDLVVESTTGLCVRIRPSAKSPRRTGRNVVVPFGSTSSTCAGCAVTQWVQILDAWDGRTYAGVPLAGRSAVLRLLLTEPSPFTTEREPPSPGPGNLSSAPERRASDHPGQVHDCRARDDGLGEGPLFRSATRHGRVSDRRISEDSIYAVVRRRVADAGFNPEGFGARTFQTCLDVGV